MKCNDAAHPHRARLAWLARQLGNLVLVAVTGVSVAYLAPTLVGYERYVITGGSMSGAIEQGAIVFARPVPVAELAVGDVITYLPPPDSGVSTLVTHRIVTEHTGRGGLRTFRTQGDANPTPDPWKFRLDEGTQPVVTHTVPILGYAFIALTDRETRMLVVGIPAGLVALASLIELVGALRPRRMNQRSVGRRVSMSPSLATSGLVPSGSSGC